MPRKFDFLSPGIEITEVDQSILPATVDADGPIIIGRFRKGPGMKPAKVRSLDNFIQVYGNPVPGGSSLKGDIWRDGPQLSAPTYAGYAAQSWLASRTSPVNVVRLLGDQHPSADATSAIGYAGWQMSGSIVANDSTNSTAYGLFIMNSSSAGVGTSSTLSFHGSYAVTALDGAGTAANKNVLSFFRNSSNAPISALTSTGGVKFQIEFDGSGTSAAGSVGSFAATGGGTDNSVPLVTITLKDSSTATSKTELMVLIEEAVKKAVAAGYISNISLDNNGETIIIHNLDSSNSLGIVDFGLTAAAAVRASVFEFDGGNIEGGYTRFINIAGTGVGEGTLGAVIYCDSGYLALAGDQANSSTAVTGSEGLIESVGANVGFKLKVFNSAGIATEEINFNFDRTSGDYIRNKLNTNPQLVNLDVTDSDDLKTYWLGESFERSLKAKVDTTNAEAQYGVLVPLHKDDVTATTNTGNWGYHRTGSAEAKSGYLIGRNYGSPGDYVGETTSTKLFRFECIHAGEEVQKNIIIGIEELKLATNETIYPYGTFSVKIMDVNGGTLEKYTGCNLDPNSPNYVARRIGDMYMEWNDTDRRYRSFGNHPNVSDYVRVRMFSEEQNYDSTDLPVGFLGPGRPKGFGALEDDVSVKTFDLGSDFAKSFITTQTGRGKLSSGEALELYGFEAVKFSFPQIPLRVNGSDGFSANPYKAYFGIRPKVATNSTLHDEDFVDYLRPLPPAYAAQQFEPTSSDGFEHSFVFSLEDIVVNTSTNTVTWTSGSQVLGTSYTATNSLSELLDKDVRQFALPLFGGFDGLDITEKEPFRQALITENLSETTNYLQYSLNKALDSVSDPETVPANLVAVPGIKNAIITNKVVSIAESRKDVLAIIDLVNDYTPSYESQDDQNTRLGSVTSAISSLKARQLNSSYAAAYYPAVQIQDNLNSGERVWVPSSVAGIGAIAQSEARSEIWFAPAGFNRGGLGNLGGRSGPRVIQARQRLDSSERDKLYEVNINPIATFPNEGVVIFGQKTLQQLPSALDRINVRRLMIFLKAEISKVARNVLFDANVESTWARFRSQAEPILSDVKAKFGLTDYRLVLDSTTTTADLIDRNILYAKVFLKPARAIEYIAIDFVITRTGADFA